MKINIFLVLVSLITITMVEGCSSGKGKTVSQSSEVIGNTVLLDSDMARNVKVVSPVVDNYVKRTKLLGKVNFDPDYTTQVYSLVNGYISKIFVTQGSSVRKGDVLVEIHSSDYASALSDYQKAKSNLNTAEKNLSRVKDLYSQRILSDKEMQLAENDYLSAKADFDKAFKTLSILGWKEGSNDPEYLIHAPISGTILYRSAEPGSEVRSDGSPLFVIGNIRKVWIELNAYQNEISELSVGDSVSIYFPGANIQDIGAKISYISSVIDQNTLTAIVRCVVDNPLGILKPNMYCIATVAHQGGKAIFIPPSSVVYDSDGNTYVFVKNGERSFEKRRIVISKMTRDGDIVSSGLNPGDKIVVEKALFLNEEFALSSK